MKKITPLLIVFIFCCIPAICHADGSDALRGLADLGTWLAKVLFTIWGIINWASFITAFRSWRRDLTFLHWFCIFINVCWIAGGAPKPVPLFAAMLIIPDVILIYTKLKEKRDRKKEAERVYYESLYPQDKNESQPDQNPL